MHVPLAPGHQPLQVNPECLDAAARRLGGPLVEDGLGGEDLDHPVGVAPDPEFGMGVDKGTRV